MDAFDTDFEPTAADLADLDGDLDMDADAWIEAMLAPSADQADDLDASDPWGLGDDPFAEPSRKKTEDEIWGDDSSDHSYSFPVQTRRVVTEPVLTAVSSDTVVAVAETGVASTTVVAVTPAMMRSALRAAGHEVGQRGALSAAQVAAFYAL